MLNSLGYQQNKNPIAQSFYIDETNGIYVTKINLYFKKYSTQVIKNYGVETDFTVYLKKENK